MQEAPLAAWAGAVRCFVAALVEPALMLSIFAVALNVGSTNLSYISATVSAMGLGALSPYQILAFVALFIIAIAETARIRWIILPHILNLQ